MPKKEPVTMSGAELKRILDKAGLTQVAAAAKIGVHKQSVYRWISGVHPISRPMTAHIRMIFQK